MNTPVIRKVSREELNRLANEVEVSGSFLISTQLYMPPNSVLTNYYGTGDHTYDGVTICASTDDEDVLFMDVYSVDNPDGIRMIAF